MLKTIIKKALPVFDKLLCLPVLGSAIILKMVRRAGVQRLPFCRKILIKVGVFPIQNHYYEPLIDYRSKKINLTKSRQLPGIFWNEIEQIELLESMVKLGPVPYFPKNSGEPKKFYFNNGSFGSGDAEFWYQFIMLKKPKQIIEIGSGNSTLLAVEAVNTLQKSNDRYQCKITCIEPFEMPWLEELSVSVRREKVEDIDTSFFKSLNKNDILFIDSSHMIRPQGDVLYEILELLPELNEGVFVHVHDIFSPNNYPKKWLTEDFRFWNEQYLLEAFLTNNSKWKIIAGLNFLKFKHYGRLNQIAYSLSRDTEPGSFYIQKSS